MGKLECGVIVHTHGSSSQEAETVGLRIQGQLAYQIRPCSKTKQNKLISRTTAETI